MQGLHHRGKPGPRGKRGRSAGGGGGATDVVAGTGINVTTDAQGADVISNTGILDVTSGSANVTVTKTNGSAAIAVSAPTLAGGDGIMVSPIGGTTILTNTGIRSLTSSSTNLLTVSGPSVHDPTLTVNPVNVVNTGLAVGAGLTSVVTADKVTLINTGVRTLIGSTGISTSGMSGDIALTNTGVTSVIAGSGITVSGATGAVTISASGGGGGGITAINSGPGVLATTTAGVTTVSSRVSLFRGSGTMTFGATGTDITLALGTTSLSGAGVTYSGGTFSVPNAGFYLVRFSGDLRATAFDPFNPMATSPQWGSIRLRRTLGSFETFTTYATMGYPTSFSYLVIAQFTAQNNSCTIQLTDNVNGAGFDVNGNINIEFERLT